MKSYLLALMMCGMAMITIAQKSTQVPVLFKVGGDPVYADEFIYLFKKNNTKGEITKAKIDEYQDLFVNFKLKVKDARALRLDTAAKFRNELETYREELKKPYRTDKDVLEKLTHEAYDRLTREVKASHILIQVKPDALPEDTLKAYNRLAELRKRILAGEDFNKIAQESSEDPSAKSNFGNLGYFTVLQMVYPFESAAYATSPGQISNIIRTRFGYHLVKVEDNKPSRGEVEIAHILLRASKEDTKARDRIFEIYEQLKSGRNWAELCKEYSEDTNTKNNGGKLRPFGVQSVYASLPEFESAAFALQNPGEVSDPFQSAVGWHIIRLEQKIPVGTYAEVESSLRKKVARDERMKISEANAQAQRLKNLGYKENDAVRDKVFSAADSSLQHATWKFKGAPALRKETILFIADHAVSADQFITWAQTAQKKNSRKPGEYIAQLFKEFTTDQINRAEEEKIIRENPDFRFLLNEYKEGILLFDAMERQVWGKASADTLGQRSFYQQHRSKYTAGPRVEARIFAVADKAVFESLKKKIFSGDTLTKADLKKFKSVQNYRNYEKGDSKVIDRINWVTGVQETALDNLFYLVEVRRLVEPGIKSFEDAHARVIADYQDELEKQWLKTLRQRYPVSLSAAGRKYVDQALLKK